MNKGSVSMKVGAAAAVSLLVAGCGGAVAGDESAPAQVRQSVRWDSTAPSSHPERPRLSTGRFHNLALKADGSVWAFGLNTDMQLGDGTTTNRWSPVQVQGLTGTFVAVGAGFYHSMALRDDGSLWAWGRNDSGQLGDGTSGADKTPVQVKNLSTVVAMAGGAQFSMALEADGDVWAWGHNSSCQLGNDSFTASSLPVQVQTADPALPNLTGVVAIAAGPASALAVRYDGSVWAWGSNADGRLGLGDSAITQQCKAVKISLDTTPEDPTDSFVAVDVAMGNNHSLALLANGTVMAWGHNGWGQLGTGNLVSSLTPIPVPGLSNVTQIDAGAYTSMAVSNGTFYAWGDYTHGQLCTGSGGGSSTSKSTVPVSPNMPYPTMSYVGAGEYFSVAMAEDGALWSCGVEHYGALGYDIPGGYLTNTLTQVPAFP